MPALEKSVDQVIHEFRRVPEDKVKQLVEDFISEGFAVEQEREGDGSYTVRARAKGRSSPFARALGNVRK